MKRSWWIHQSGDQRVSKSSRPIIYETKGSAMLLNNDFWATYCNFGRHRVTLESVTNFNKQILSFTYIEDENLEKHNSKSTFLNYLQTKTPYKRFLTIITRSSNLSWRQSWNLANLTSTLKDHKMDTWIYSQTMPAVLWKGQPRAPVDRNPCSVLEHY